MIQPNPPGVVFRMVFDVDKPRQPEPFFSWDLAGLPPPNWISMNPGNGHCHLVYEIEDPVSLAGESRSGRYLSAIETAYGAALKADPAYHGNLVKNPAHPDWWSYRLRGKMYSLGELADWIELPKKKKSSVRTDEYIFYLGRNCAVFEIARKEAYSIVRGYWSQGGYVGFRKEVLGIVEGAWEAIQKSELWGGKDHPYRIHEIKNTTDSIARWTWKNISPKKTAEMIEKTHSSEIQSKRGTKSGQKRREKSDTEFDEAIRRTRLRYSAFEIRT